MPPFKRPDPDEPAPDRGSSRVHWTAVASGVFAVVLVVGTIAGWMYTLSGQSYALADTTRRVTVLETRRDASDKDTADVVNRLARIEGKLEIMLSRVGGK